jgi:hypothetical protein
MIFRTALGIYGAGQISAANLGSVCYPSQSRRCQTFRVWVCRRLRFRSQAHRLPFQFR